MERRLIPIEEARQVLGDDVMIVLEPTDVHATKLSAGRGEELWGFSLADGRIRRGDKRFHAAGVTRHPGGWNTCVIIEEPGVETQTEGRRVIGHVIVDVNPRRLVRVRRAAGVNGEILELRPSSLSKGELDQSGRQPDGYFEANPQRIEGVIAVFRNDVDFPDEEGMSPEEFRRQSTDGRSLAALAKLAL